MSQRQQGLPPVLGPGTRVVVLGSFPGAASLAAGQYYAHPRNAFWPILGALWGVDLRALSYQARLDELQRRGLGLWDLYASCRRPGSLDAAIHDARRNPLERLRWLAPRLAAVLHNGGESAKGMALTASLGLPVHRLPSTSPANASWTFERKCAAWGEVLSRYGVV